MTPPADTRYDRIGVGYARTRQEDPRIAAHIHAALGYAHTIVNVGAGAGSYEPRDRPVIAVEPSDLRQLDTYDAGLRLVVNTPKLTAPAPTGDR